MKHPTTLRGDERGVAFVQLAALIIAPIIAVAIVAATLSVVRTGSGLVESLQRGAVAQVMLSDLKSSVGAATTLDAKSATSFSLVTDPVRLPPAVYVSLDAVPNTCRTSTWTLEPAGGLVSLTHTQTDRKTADCSSAVKDTRKSVLTGIQPGAKFTYANSLGRDLDATSTGISVTPGAAPAGASAADWDSVTVGAVTIEATMQEMFGSRNLKATARTWVVTENLPAAAQGSATWTVRCNNDGYVSPPVWGASGVANWSDGVSTALSPDTRPEPRPVSAGQELQVTVVGDFEQVGTRELDSSEVTAGVACFRSMDAWTGDTSTTSMSSAFRDMVNLTAVPQSIPSTVTDLRSAFAGAVAFDQPLGTWDVSNVTTMSNMFNGSNRDGQAYRFNQPLDSWDVSNVTDMSYMFRQAREFNQPLATWDVGNVKNMTEMFAVSGFNQPIGVWNVGNVESMSGMFSETGAFNQPLGAWDMSKVKTIDDMFYAAVAFNGAIGQWNLGSISTLDRVFYAAESFNADITSWDVSKVVSMNGTFQAATSFNQPIGGWNVASVTNMQNMFNAATTFNQPLGSWDVKNVKNMAFMFFQASTFNQPIGGWNVGNVEAMTRMFGAADVFNQLLAGWNVSKVSDVDRYNLEYFAGQAFAKENQPNFRIN